jgi:hypothetical protein
METGTKPRFRLKLQSPGSSEVEEGVDFYRMRRQIKGALKSAIAAHGPIHKNLIGSVLKRLEHEPVYKGIVNGREKKKAA